LYKRTNEVAHLNSALKRQGYHVWVERHYHQRPWVGDAATKCDSVIDPGGDAETWIEFKVVAEDNKPCTHRNRWIQVVQRLEGLCNRHPRIEGLFCLLMFFNQQGELSQRGNMVTAVQEFCPDHLFCSPVAASWQWTDTTRVHGRTYSNMAVWIWKWPKPAQAARPGEYAWIEV
jgi:hypothetical protein